MKLSSRILSLVMIAAIGAVTLTHCDAQITPTSHRDWDPPAAAQYLDDRIRLWFERASELKTGDGKTTCISCHTVVPYLLARPALRKEMHVNDPTPLEVRLLN